MAVVTVFSSRWKNGTFLIGHDVASIYGWPMVTVRFGVYAETGPTKNIEQARDKFKLWGLQGDEIADVDGKRVPEDFTLEDGHVLTFHRPR